jgi:hypothetical protein
MLPFVYKYLHGKQIPIFDITKNPDLLCDYIEAYLLGLEKTVESGKPTEEFCFYFDQLKEIAIMFPTFNYQRLLCQKYADTLGYFYNLPKEREMRKKH